MPRLTITRLTSGRTPTGSITSVEYHTVSDCWVAARAFQQEIDYGADRDAMLIDKGVLLGRQDAGVGGIAYVGPRVEYRIEVTA